MLDLARLQDTLQDPRMVYYKKTGNESVADFGWQDQARLCMTQEW
jgi:hypothetical protein